MKTQSDFWPIVYTGVVCGLVFDVMFFIALK